MLNVYKRLIKYKHIHLYNYWSLYVNAPNLIVDNVRMQTRAFSAKNRHDKHSDAVNSKKIKNKAEEASQLEEIEDTLSAPNEPGAVDRLVDAIHERRKSAAANTRQLSPVLRQYHKLKAEYPNHLLMFRLGDFYEMLYEDAVVASNALDIALTRRRRKARRKRSESPSAATSIVDDAYDDSESIPMSGVPFHSLHNHLEKLIRAGIRVAICDQVEEAEVAKRERRIVRRQVTRIVTPGTLYEDRLLDRRAPNYLATIARGSHDSLSLAWLDLSTGEFQLSSSSLKTIVDDLARVAPAELLLSAELAKTVPIAHVVKRYDVTIVDESTYSESITREHYASTSLSLLDERAVAALLSYVRWTQCGTARLTLPKLFQKQSVMTIDSSTRRQLELTESSSVSLLSTVDKTVTAVGARELGARLRSPLMELDVIAHRHDLVAYFVSLYASTNRLQDFRSPLGQCYDLQRCLQRLLLGRGTPRDLAHIAQTLDRCGRVRDVLLNVMERTDESIDDETHTPVPDSLRWHVDQLGRLESLTAHLRDVLAPEAASVSAQSNVSGFVRESYSARLDQLRLLCSDSHASLASIQERYREQTALRGLRVRRTPTAGFFVEVASKQVSAVPDTWMHCQTLLNSMRYRTPELIEMESRVNTADEEALELETNIFNDTVTKVLEHETLLRDLSSAIASVDIALSSAKGACESALVRPTILESDTIFEIVDGRHAVVDAAQRDRGAFSGSFTPNDCSLSPPRSCLLITGPNMGGKSTYLRQQALIAIMAQAGLYVPARSATLSVIDAIFTRIGASDDLANYQSTFMVEMLETANILMQATERSLVVIDEVGRGTSTSDGMALAHAILERLLSMRCRTLFATHYHELAPRLEHHERMRCMYTDALLDGDEVTFLHKLKDGYVDRSYGINVARLAGVPVDVLERATTLLDQRVETSGRVAASDIER